MNVSLRTPEMEEKYQEYLKQPKEVKCCFCREIVFRLANATSAITREWKNWYLMSNDFPYDAVFSRHDLLFPKRHVPHGELTLDEVDELKKILEELSPEYHQLIENLGSRISQPGHWHIHLCVFYV